MCLKVKGIEFKEKTANEDIVVYKVLSYRGSFKSYGGPIFDTPYMCSKVSLGKRYTISGEYKFDRVKKFWQKAYYVYGKSYHTFKNRSDAEAFVDNFEKSYNFCVVEAVIPSGSKYVEGEFISADFGKVPCYASDAVEYKKVLYPDSIVKSYKVDEIVASRPKKDDILKTISDLEDIIGHEADCVIVGKAEAELEIYNEVLTTIKLEEAFNKAKRVRMGIEPWIPPYAVI